jgi:hypothetical protein
MNGQAFTLIVVAIVTPLLLKGMGKFFPSKAPIPSESEFSNKEVQKWNLISFGLYMVFWGVIGLPLWWILTQIYRLYLSLCESTEIFVGPPDVTFSMPAFFAALALGAYIVTIFLRRKLGVRYEAYCLASSRQYGVAIDSDTLGKVMGPVMLTAALAGALCIFRAKIAFYEDSMLSCGPIFCESHAYSDISEIGQATHFRAPNGNTVANLHLFLRFKDGSLWAPFMLRGEVAKQEEIMKFLGRKTGLEIKTAEMLPEK